MSQKIALIGAPFDLCGPVLGSRLGPISLRLHGLAAMLCGLGCDVRDTGDAFDLISDSPATLDQCYPIGLAAYRSLKDRVTEVIESGSVPVVLGGDHSLSIGSVSGAMAAYGEDLAVLWIDAHMDLHTPASTTSGNVHGMPIGALAGLADEPGAKPWSPALDLIWQVITRDIVPQKKLLPSHAAWIGLRDVDPGEIENSKQMAGSYITTMQDVDRDGIAKIAQDFRKWMVSIEAKKLWISFDVDCLDPVHAPGTGTAVRGGLSYREGHLLAEMLFEFLHVESPDFELAGVDLVEVNPLQDTGGETARVTAEWVGSLFGKSILGSRRKS